MGKECRRRVAGKFILSEVEGSPACPSVVRRTKTGRPDLRVKRDFLELSTCPEVHL